MSKLRCHISISVDGFVAGPNQSEENPLGEGGERLHDWVVPLAAWRQSHDKQGGEVNESTRIFEESAQNVGASVMGRNMFGPIGGGARRRCSPLRQPRGRGSAARAGPGRRGARRHPPQVQGGDMKRVAERRESSVASDARISRNGTGSRRDASS